MGRPGADVRARRLLAIVPWVAANDGPTVEEVCTRFEITEADLAAEFQMLGMCGLYPYTPDMLVDADIADGRVWIRYADYFSRPLRLSPPEALGLLASSAALLAVPGTDPEGPLARGLAKLAVALKIEASEVLEVELAQPDSASLNALRDAVEQHRKVAIDYYTYGRDQRSTRVVHPLSVHSADGQWYLSAHCEAALGLRLFRIDRINAVTPLDDTFEPPPDVPAAGAFHPHDDDPVVTLELKPAASWVVDQYPLEGVVELKGGRRKVEMRITEDAWFERLLLRLGPDARVVKGDAGAACRAARRVLDRYQRR